MRAADPDELQRKAADPSGSAWVAASAGSGKTKVLSDRVLNLLLCGTAPEKILCLTFTRTAAAQMANKIMERLARWASVTQDVLYRELTELQGHAANEDRMACARQLFAKLLDTPGGLKVTTLHGFCQSLLKRFPLEAGLPTHFDVLDERGAQELIEQAQNKILSQSKYEKYLEIITAVTDEKSFLNVLKEMTAKLNCLKQTAERLDSSQKLKNAYEKALDLPENCDEASLKKDFCSFSGQRKDDLMQAIKTLAQSSKKTDKEKSFAINNFINASFSEKIKTLPNYLSIFLTNENTIRKQLVCKESEQVEPIIRFEAEKAIVLKKQLVSLKTLELSFALFKIGSAILNMYIRLKNERGFLDYDDLISTTKALLEKSGAAAWVLYKLDGGIDHILVDEAQDTSPNQWAIIKALAEEFFAGYDGIHFRNRTIFAVGDQKQSIFGFQGAVPEEFERMRLFFKEKVENARKVWNDVPMYISFRSVPAIIDTVNYLLKNESFRKGVVEKDKEATHLSWRKNQGGLMEIWPPEKPLENDTVRTFTKPVERVYSQTSSARLAAKIAQKIAAMIHCKEILLSENRPIAPSDILILVRKRDSFINDVSRELKIRGIPVSGVDRLKITSHIAVKDLMALGDFLLLPENDLALACVLRSPLCGVSAKDLSDDDLNKAKELKIPLDGISEQDLFSLAYDRGDLSLFDRLKQYENRPETSLGKALLFLKDLLSRVDKMLPYELYAYVLGPLMRQKAFICRLGIQSLDALDEFMSLALEYDKTQSPCLQNFLKYLRDNDIEIKRDPEQTSFNAVRIMTVHAAKGLQAPVVFLPDTRQTPCIKQQTFWTDRNTVVLWAPNAKLRCDAINKEIEKLKQKEQEEYHRLLYVALTRAADRLYICAWDNKKIKNGNWYDLIKEAFSISDGNGNNSLRVESVKTELFDEPVLRLSCEQKEKPPLVNTPVELSKPSDLPEWINSPAPQEPTPPKPLVPSRPDIDEPPALSPLTQGRIQALKKGTIIHSLLEILPQYPCEQRKNIAEKIVKTYKNNFTSAEMDTILHDILALFESPEFTILFSPDSLAEVPVSGIVDQRIINAKIDRLAFFKDEIHIVDYKSGHLISQNSQKTPTAYIHQMSAYKALIKKIYPDKNIRCFLLWTEIPELHEITSAVFDTLGY